MARHLDEEPVDSLERHQGHEVTFGSGAQVVEKPPQVSRLSVDRPLGDGTVLTKERAVFEQERVIDWTQSSRGRDDPTPTEVFEQKVERPTPLTTRRSFVAMLASRQLVDEKRLDATLIEGAQAGTALGDERLERAALGQVLVDGSRLVPALVERLLPVFPVVLEGGFRGTHRGLLSPPGGQREWAMMRASIMVSPLRSGS